eukprot:6756107-Heterocapsa_arctica.AAC.1
MRFSGHSGYSSSEQVIMPRGSISARLARAVAAAAAGGARGRRRPITTTLIRMPHGSSARLARAVAAAVSGGVRGRVLPEEVRVRSRPDLAQVHEHVVVRHHLTATTPGRRRELDSRPWRATVEQLPHR